MPQAGFPAETGGEGSVTLPNGSWKGGLKMLDTGKESIKALLIQARHNPLDALRLALEEQSMEIHIAKNCAEAALALWSDAPPHLVFTEVQFADGNWADVLTLARESVRASECHRGSAVRRYEILFAGD